MELLYRFEAELGAPVPVGPAGDGVRIDIPFAGRLTDGLLAGGRGWGVEYLTQRRDGIGVIDARDTFEVPGGFLHAKAQGFVVHPGGARPELTAAMLEPVYEPADVDLVIDGFALCQTGVPALEHLNRALVKIDGHVNNATGELVFEGRATPASAAALAAAKAADAGLGVCAASA